MESWAAFIPIPATLVAIALPPILLAGACALGLRVVDDRGLYAVPPLLGLPIVAGGLLEGYLLIRTGLIEGLLPSAIWSVEGPWHLDLRGLYATYLAPPRIVELFRFAARDAEATWPAARPWAIAYAAASAPVAIVAGFAWRSWRAVPAAALFVPISLTSAVVVHDVVVIACWTLHWLNFWALFVLVLLLDLRRREGNGQLLAP